MEHDTIPSKRNEVIEEYIPPKEKPNFFHRIMADIVLFLWYFINTPLFIIWPMMIGSVIYFRQCWFIILAYLAWMYYDRHVPYNGGRRAKLYRKFNDFLFDKYYRDYFPVGLVKTCELPPTKNYMLCMAPHGVLSIGCLTNFCWCRKKAEQFFPNIVSYNATLNINFIIPFVRETILNSGGISANEESILNFYKKHTTNTGAALTVVIGGAKEAFLSTVDGEYRLLLNRRKGFIRVALKAGVPLVPIFTFGENDYYELVENKYFAKVQNIIYKISGIACVVLKGESWGPIPTVVPKKTRLISVVGSPIDIPKIENPSKDEIEKYHAIFKEELICLFEEHKEKYDPRGSKAKLIFV